jgi:glyoxylase-like metal-dependent hydrolase (beta-lactamase superfamily II)
MAPHMKPLADDAWHIPLGPRDAVNTYVLGDVLVDSGYKFQSGRAIAAARRLGVTEHALTHAHLDHAGGSAKVCRELGLPGVAVGATDAADVRSGRPEPPPHTPLKPVGRWYGSFEAAPVIRELAEGDVVGPGFVVLDVPGHSRGHVAFWREADRVLITGDVLFDMHLITTAPGLREPPRPFTTDPALNRRSIRRIAALEPRVVGFGHGPVLREDAAAKLAAVAAALPAD